MEPSYIIDLINTKTNTRYLLRSNEGVLFWSIRQEKWKSHLVTDPSVWLRPLYETLFLLASAPSNVFLLLGLILKLIF